MVKLSNTVGKLTITAECDEKKFMEFQESLRTYLTSEEYGARFNVSNNVQNDNGTCSVTVGFIGWGNRVFDEYLYRFGLLAKKSNCKALDAMKKISFKLIFDFIDCSEELELLYTEEAAIEHKANDSWEETEYVKIDQENLDYTFANIAKLYA
jgi:hypothetical protein